jgi:hypothetical protein
MTTALDYDPTTAAPPAAQSQITSTASPAEPGVRDFSAPRRNVSFKIDDDTFQGVNDLPAMALIEFAGMVDQLNELEVAQQPQIFTQLFQMVLEPTSSELFLRRMGDREKPISLGQLMEIMPWIMEQYGLRPTTPSEASSDGSEPQATGTSSTDSAQPLESIPDISTLNAS